MPYFLSGNVDSLTTEKKEGSYNEYSYKDDCIINEVGRYINNERVGFWVKLENGVLDSFMIYTYGAVYLADRIENYNYWYFNTDTIKESVFWYMNKEFYKYNGYRLQRSGVYNIDSNDANIYTFQYYEEGVLQGPVIVFYKRCLSIVAKYVSGFIDGKTYWYNTNGSLKSEIGYKNGWLDGDAILYNGTRESYLVYKNGHLIYQSVSTRRLVREGWYDKRRSFYKFYCDDNGLLIFGEGFQGDGGFRK